MSGTLFIRLKDAGKSAAEKLTAQSASFDEAGRPTGDVTESMSLPALLESVTQLPERGEIIVLLPADRVFTTEITLPRSQASQLARSPAYAIEDQLIEPIEQLHVVAGKPVEAEGDNVRCTVMAVDRLWLQEVESAFSARALYPRFIASEAAPLQPPAGHIALLLEGAQALVATGTTATRLDNDSLAVFLTLLANKSTDDAPLRHLDVYAASGSPAAMEQTLAAWAREHGLEFHYQPLPEAALSWMASRWPAARPDAINLSMTGGGILGSGEWFTLIRRIAAAIIIGIIAQAGVNGVTSLYYSMQSASLYRQAEASYRAHLPKTMPEGDVHAAMAAYIARHSLGGQSGIVAFLGKLATVLAGAGTEPHLSYLHYREKDRMLDMRVTADSFDAFEQYRQALAGAGITANMDSLTRRATLVEGTIHVRTR